VSTRKKCERVGHKFRDIGVPLPYVFCARWRCEASAVSHWADPRIAVDLHNAIPIENRFPPVDLGPDGQVIRPGSTTPGGDQ
jgi:hypothetical protein